MAEVEIHTAHHHDGDAFGQGVGILVGVIGILLSIVTILSHREHTAAVVHKTEASDQWAYYQAKKIREHADGVGLAMLDALGTDGGRTGAAAAKLQQEQGKYESDAVQIQKVAEAKDAQSEHSEQRALRFDLGEGLLELGLVMSSLYFLSRRRFFVAFGAVAAVIGSVIGMLGWLA
jgi:hypothetical protein